MDDRPTFGSLFAGIGGLDLGLERAGWRCAWQVEFDEFCRRVLAKHWPAVARFADVRMFPSVPAAVVADVSRADREQVRLLEALSVDLICGGFPCQPVSYAGNRLAQADDRWLWPEFARVVRTLRPRYVFVENVPGLLVRGFGDVLGDLADLGFDAEWSVLSACAVGAPHTRERVFIVAHARQERGRSRFLDGGTTTSPWETSESDRQAAESCRARLATWWETEPAMGRLAHGVLDGVGQLGAFGNAVVPQVAEWIGRRLMEVMTADPQGASVPAAPQEREGER